MIATIESRQADAQMIAQALQSYTGSIEVLPGPPEQPIPAKRTSWIDPEAKLKRKKQKPAGVSVYEKRLESMEKARAVKARNRRELEKEWGEESISALARRKNVPKSTLLGRINSGMTPEQAVSAQDYRRKK